MTHIPFRYILLGPVTSSPINGGKRWEKVLAIDYFSYSSKTEDFPPLSNVKKMAGLSPKSRQLDPRA